MNIEVRCGDICIKPDMQIGYVYQSETGKFIFRLERILTIHIGVHKSKIVCKRYSFDLNDVIINTQIAKTSKAVLKNNPFLANKEYISFCNETIDKWNKKLEDKE